ncbi:MAG: ABC transporter permease [Anaerolineaceae bacterium]|nr:MAG: ABC transporter permease [Anaerolineaceae bacterium]
MNTRTNFMDNLYIAWAIGSKDIVDALKNKNTRTNIIMLVFIVVFFYWSSTPRPFDKKIDVAIYDEGHSSLTDLPTELEDGYRFAFHEASSLQEMERMMGYKQLGVVIPPDFDQVLEAGGEPELAGYILWVHRTKVSDLELKYSEKFSELLGRPVRVDIGENLVIPQPDVETSTVHFTILFAVLWMAVTIVPHLMMEERQTRTMEALLVSPASAGQVVMGKALAGAFYVLLSGGLFFALNWAYVTHWGLALLAFLCTALFSIGIALLLGVFVSNPKQMTLWMIPIVVLLLVPAFFAQEPNLTANLKAIFSWLPTTALLEITQFSFSTHAPLSQLLTNLAIALGSTVVVYAIVIWKVRRSDR